MESNSAVSRYDDEGRGPRGRAAAPGPVWGLLAAAVCVIALAILVGLALVYARHEMAAGVDALHSAETQLRGQSLQRSPDFALANALSEVQSAHDRFVRAELVLGPLGPVLNRMGWAPRVGTQLVAAPKLASAGKEATWGAVLLIRGVQPIVHMVSHRAGGTSGSILPALLGRLAAGRADFVESCAQFSRASSVRAGIRSGGSALLSSGLRSFDREIPKLNGLCRGLTLLPGLLGYPHAVTYLVAYQDPHYLRATGGFIGSIGKLEVHDGRTRQTFLGAGLRDNLSVPPPEPMAYYNREPGWLLRDSNWSPDFPTTAALERFFFQLDLGWTGGGVIDLTPQAAADLVGALGPIYVPEYKKWVTADNVAELADYYVHQSGRHGPYSYSTEDTSRKQFLPIVAQHVFSRLGALSSRQLIRVADAVSTAVEHRDLLLSFQRPADQDLVKLVGADGGVSQIPSDYLYVVDSNLSYNRINEWVHTSIDYRVHIESNRWLRGTLTVRIHNTPAPPSALFDAYGPGAGTLGGPDDYADFLRIYVPRGAQILSQSGWRQAWSPGDAYGRTMFSGYIIVRRGQTREVHLHYLMPPNSLLWSGGRRYRLFVQHQPGSYPDRLSVSVTDGVTGRTKRRAVSRPTTDWSVTVPIVALPVQPVPLPRATFPTVAPAHWIEPHAYLAPPRG